MPTSHLVNYCEALNLFREALWCTETKVPTIVAVRSRETTMAVEKVKTHRSRGILSRCACRPPTVRKASAITSANLEPAGKRIRTSTLLNTVKSTMNSSRKKKKRNASKLVRMRKKGPNRSRKPAEYSIVFSGCTW